MEKRDLELIKKYVSVDKELKQYVDEHQKLEEMLELYNKRVYLSSKEEMEMKKIKIKKLRGRDKIEKILSKYRNAKQ